MSSCCRNGNEIEIVLDVDKAGRLNGDYRRVRGQHFLLRLRIEALIACQVAFLNQLAQRIAVLEKKYPVMARRVAKGRGQSVVPLEGTCGGQPAGAGAVTVGANLNPLRSAMLTCVHRRKMQ